jgi:hypothetical protein
VSSLFIFSLTVSLSLSSSSLSYSSSSSMNPRSCRQSGLISLRPPNPNSKEPNRQRDTQFVAFIPVALSTGTRSTPSTIFPSTQIGTNLSSKTLSTVKRILFLNSNLLLHHHPHIHSPRHHITLRYSPLTPQLLQRAPNPPGKTDLSK